MEDTDAPANRLDPRVKTAWRVQAALAFVPLFIGAAIGAAVLAANGLVGFAALTVAVALGWLLAAETVVPELRYRRWRWEVAEQEVRLREGLFVLKSTVIPMVRVQHVDTAQGPVMGALGLSDVHIWTAAGQHTIPALSDDHAAQLRDRIAVLARVTDDGGL